MTSRAEALVARLERASGDLVAVIEGTTDREWRHIADAAVWSIGKDAEHVADAARYHQWIVRFSIGEKVSSQRPSIERKQMTSDLSPAQAVALLRERTDDGVRLVRSLTDEQLDLPTRPPRARDQRLAATIEQVLIGHYDGHRMEIESKLRALG